MLILIDNYDSFTYNLVHYFEEIGQKVKVLNSTFQHPGYYSINWDGKNDNGVSVPSGVYFYTISSKSFQKTKKMLYLK